jgi:pilus assembly protein FimV
VTAAALAPSVPSFDLPEMKSSQSSVDSAVLDEPAALDFDFSPTSTVEKASAKLGGLSLDAAPSNEALSDAVAGRFELPSLDLPARAPSAAPKVEAEVPVFSNSAISDLGDLKIELPMASQEAPAIDLSAIGLDLQPSTLAAPAGADSARWQEMATKLDLAAAYEEIGDKEGARELLDEVVRGGDSEQQQKARSMLSKLS